jgi:hypothetical protein
MNANISNTRPTDTSPAETRLILTVTSAEGKPTLNLPGSLPAHEVGKIVRDRFGMQTSGNTPAIAHSYCGALVPPPPTQKACTISILTRRGHLRGF